MIERFRVKSYGALYFLAAIVIILFFTGHAGAAGSGDVKYLNYGVLAPLSGAAAPWGISQARMCELAAKDINDRGGFTVGGQTYKWKTVTYDMKWSPTESRTALERLIADGVKFVNMQSTACVLACADLLKTNNILLIAHAFGGKTVTNPDNPLFFRGCMTIREKVYTMYPWFKKNKGVRTIAVIADDSEAGHSASGDSELAAKRSDMKIVTTAYYEPETTDFYPLLSRCLAKKPDMIDTTLAHANESALIAKQARELGFKGIIYVGTEADPKQWVSLATKKHAEGVYMAGLKINLTTEHQKRVKKMYTDKYGEGDWDPNALNHEHLYYITQAIKKANSLDTAKVSKALASLEWDGLNGPSRWGGKSIYGIDRQIVFPTDLVQFKDGNPVRVGEINVPKNY